MQKLEYYTFYDCKNLTSVILPEGLESIGEDCFKNTKLKTVTVPKNTYIADSAFPEDCEIRRE